MYIELVKNEFKLTGAGLASLYKFLYCLGLQTQCRGKVVKVVSREDVFVDLPASFDHTYRLTWRGGSNAQLCEPIQ